MERKIIKSLLGICILFSMTSCLHTAEENLHSNKEKDLSDTIIKQKMCLDTAFLQKHNIAYKRVLGSGNSERWLLVVVKENLTPEIDKVHYYYSTQCPASYGHQKILDFHLDSCLVYTSKGFSQLISIQGMVCNLLDMIHPDIKLVDINFDNYLDLSFGLNEISGATNELRQYHLYNSSQGRYSDALLISDLVLDKKNKLLHQNWSGGHAGKIGMQVWSDFVEFDSLRTVKSIESIFIDSLQVYVQTSNTLLADSQYEISRDTIGVMK